MRRYPRMLVWMASIVFALIHVQECRAVYLSFLADPNLPADNPTNLITISPGQARTISLYAINDTTTAVTLHAVDVALGVNQSVFSISNAQVGTLTQGFTATFFPVNNGQLDATMSSVNGATLAARPGGSGTFTRAEVLRFELRALDQAPVDLYALNLRATGFNVVTAIDEGQVPLLPAPTNLPNDPFIDGLVGVVAVPEPSSLALLGFGLLAACSGRRRRCRARA